MLEASGCAKVDIPRPVPTMTAVGVARPRAQGQAVTSTLMKQLKARMKGDAPWGREAGSSTA